MKLSRKTKSGYPKTGTGARQGARIARQARYGLLTLTTPAELRRAVAQSRDLKRVVEFPK